MAPRWHRDRRFSCLRFSALCLPYAHCACPLRIVYVCSFEAKTERSPKRERVCRQAKYAPWDNEKSCRTNCTLDLAAALGSKLRDDSEKQAQTLSARACSDYESKSRVSRFSKVSRFVPKRASCLTGTGPRKSRATPARNTRGPPTDESDRKTGAGNSFTIPETSANHFSTRGAFGQGAMAAEREVLLPPCSHPDGLTPQRTSPTGQLSPS